MVTESLQGVERPERGVDYLPPSRLRTGRSRVRTPVEARYFSLVQASCPMVTESLHGVERPERGVYYLPPSRLRTRRSRVRTPVEAIYFALVPASCPMGTEYLQGVERPEHGVDCLPPSGPYVVYGQSYTCAFPLCFHGMLWGDLYLCNSSVNVSLQNNINNRIILAVGCQPECARFSTFRSPVTVWEAE